LKNYVEESMSRVSPIRAQVIAYIRLREYFGIQADLPPFEQAMIVTTEAGQYGLVVDRVLGDCQTMVKSLGKLYGGISEFSGATILGNGSVALILDPLRLVQERLKTASSSSHNLIRSSTQGRKGTQRPFEGNDGGRDSLQAYSNLQQTGAALS
jgi:chemotaxis protein histidine kinase CheA